MRYRVSWFEGSVRGGEVVVLSSLLSLPPRMLSCKPSILPWEERAEGVQSRIYGIGETAKSLVHMRGDLDVVLLSDMLSWFCFCISCRVSRCHFTTRQNKRNAEYVGQIEKDMSRDQRKGLAVGTGASKVDGLLCNGVEDAVVPSTVESKARAGLISRVIIVASEYG